MDRSDAPEQRYAAGLPWVGTRTLDPSERSSYLRQLSRLRWTLRGGLAAIVAAAVGAMLLGAHVDLAAVGGPVFAWLGAVGLAGVLGCLVAARGGWRILAALGSIYLLGIAAFGRLTPQLVPRPQGLDAAVIVGMILLGTSFVVHAGATRWLLVRRREQVAADLEAGVVDRYAGRTTAQPPAALRRLLPDVAPQAEARIEVLPTSGLVVRVDGRRSVWRPAHVARIAPTLPHALRVGLPRDLAATAADPRLKLERRSLSPQERRELIDHAQRLRRRWGPVAVVSLAVAGVIAWHVTRAQTLADAFDVVSLLWYALAIVAWTSYVRRLRAAHKLTCDERLRWVVTVGGADASADTTPPRLEVLPVSQLAWTEHARPAGWRVDEF